jgi:hypothetical protein
MKRKLTVFGFASVLALVLSAAGASAALAGTPRVTSAGYPANLNLAAVNGSTTELKLEGGRKVFCEIEYKGEYTFTQSQAATWSIEVAPTCNNSSALILGNITPATITFNNCKTTLNSETTVSTTEQTGSWNVNCPGSPIEIHVWQTSAKHLANETALCTYTIGHQTNNLPGLTHKLFSSTELEVVDSTTGISVSRTGGTITNCGAASQSAGHTGIVRGSATKGGVAQTLSMDPS